MRILAVLAGVSPVMAWEWLLPVGIGVAMLWGFWLGWYLARP